MGVALKVEDLIASTNHPIVSSNCISILQRAREEAFKLGKTPLVEPTHFVSSMLALPLGGYGGTILRGHLTTTNVLQLRQMLSENDWRYDFRVRDGSITLEGLEFLDELFDQIHLQRTYEDVVYSSLIDQVLERSQEIAKELGKENEVGSGEILAAVLDVCKDDLRVKLLVKNCGGITSQNVINELRKSYRRN